MQQFCKRRNSFFPPFLYQRDPTHCKAKVLNPVTCVGSHKPSRVALFYNWAATGRITQKTALSSFSHRWKYNAPLCVLSSHVAFKNGQYPGKVVSTVQTAPMNQPSTYLTVCKGIFINSFDLLCPTLVWNWFSLIYLHRSHPKIHKVKMILS